MTEHERTVLGSIEAPAPHLYLINSYMHRAKWEAVCPDRAITPEGLQAYVDF